MRALLFTRDDRDLDLLEPGAFEKLMELDFAEARAGSVNAGSTVLANRITSQPMKPYPPATR